MPYAVDWPKLAEELTALQRERGLSDRDLGRELGLSYTVFSGLRHGCRVHGDTLAAIVAWVYPDRIPPWIREVPVRRPRLTIR